MNAMIFIAQCPTALTSTLFPPLQMHLCPYESHPVAEVARRIPFYFQIMIRRCQEPDLKARPTARGLLDIVADVEAGLGFEMDMERFRQEYSDTFFRNRLHRMNAAF